MRSVCNYFVSSTNPVYNTFKIYLFHLLILRIVLTSLYLQSSVQVTFDRLKAGSLPPKFSAIKAEAGPRDFLVSSKSSTTVIKVNRYFLLAQYSFLIDSFLMDSMKCCNTIMQYMYTCIS